MGFNELYSVVLIVRGNGARQVGPVRHVFLDGAKLDKQTKLGEEARARKEKRGREGGCGCLCGMVRNELSACCWVCIFERDRALSDWLDS